MQVGLEKPLRHLSASFPIKMQPFSSTCGCALGCGSSQMTLSSLFSHEDFRSLARSTLWNGWKKGGGGGERF